MSKNNEIKETTSLRISKKTLKKLGELGRLLPVPVSANGLGEACLEAMIQMMEGNSREVERIMNAFESAVGKYPPPGETNSTSKHASAADASRTAAATAALGVHGQSPPADAPTGATSRSSKGAGKGQGGQQ